MNQDHYRKLERMYLSANINQSFFESTSIEIFEKRAEISLTVSDKYFHALGAMHGSVYFKLLDDAAFFAVSSVVDDVIMLTSSFHLHFVRPVLGGKLKAVGKLKYLSKNVYVGEASLFNEDGKEVAFGTGDFMKSRMHLSDKFGYK